MQSDVLRWCHGEWQQWGDQAGRGKYQYNIIVIIIAVIIITIIIVGIIITIIIAAIIITIFVLDIFGAVYECSAYIKRPLIVAVFAIILIYYHNNNFIVTTAMMTITLIKRFSRGRAHHSSRVQLCADFPPKVTSPAKTKKW